MATYYVSTTGNDASAGTSSGAAWATITRALDSSASGTKIVAGDTVLIEQGTYNENPVIDISGTVSATITIRGMATGFTTPTWGTRPVIVTGQFTTTLSSGWDCYYRFENIEQSGYAGVGWLLTNLDFLIFINCASLNNTGASSDGFQTRLYSRYINCVANGNGRDGFNAEVGSSNGMQYFGCVAKDNTRHGFNGYTDSYYYINCLAHNNGNTGINLPVSPPTNTTIINCTVDGNTTRGVYGGGRFFTFLNNIISNNGTGVVGYSSDANNSYARNNLYYGNTSDRSNFPAGTSDITGSDPLFTNRASDDFTLQASSPAARAGYPANIDLGAYQMTLPTLPLIRYGLAGGING